MMSLMGIAYREKSRAPMLTKTEAMITRVSGVDGDFRGKPGKRQVTVLSKIQWKLACEQLGASLPWTMRRANLLVDHICFGPEMVGQQIKIGQLILLITRETDPCPRMDEQHQGLTQALIPDWRGGVCCKVIADGRVTVGDILQIS